MANNVIFFFGAGADVPYGMPDGGEFALEIFRTIGDEDKKELRKEISKVDILSNQSKWFPDSYKDKSITIFRKNNYESIIASMLENRRDSIISELSNFDLIANKVKDIFLKYNLNIDDILATVGCAPGSKQYSQAIRLNSKLDSNLVQKFFGSNYLSALMNLIQNNRLENEKLIEASNLCRSFIEIMIGALGKNLVDSLNNGIFERIPQELPFLDDIGGIFELDYRKIGIEALSNLISKKSFYKRVDKINKEKDNETIIIEFYLKIAEIIYSTFLDYQNLIDSHYRYLYQPGKEWGKFCKISTFLFAVHRYMSDLLSNIKVEAEAYYEDIRDFKEINLVAIGTSNYTNLVKRTKCTDIFYLNGSLDEFYDPYKNDIVSYNSSAFNVPFIFTQSGTKPMTSIKMSERYSQFYNKCKNSDRIIILGYGFNSDDGHINTLIRSLIDDCNKSIDIILYNTPPENFKNMKQEISRKIRCENMSKILIHSINDNRMINERKWLTQLFDNNK